LANLASLVYARGIEEAPGHVALARAEYRQISRAWYSWLRFAFYLGGRASAHETALEPKISYASVDLLLLNAKHYVSEISRNQGTSKRVYNVLDL
jgi:hypothetical protein